MGYNEKILDVRNDINNRNYEIAISKLENMLKESNVKEVEDEKTHIIHLVIMLRKLYLIIYTNQKNKYLSRTKYFRDILLFRFYKYRFKKLRLGS